MDIIKIYIKMAKEKKENIDGEDIDEDNANIDLDLLQEVFDCSVAGIITHLEEHNNHYKNHAPTLKGERVNIIAPFRDGAQHECNRNTKCQ